MAWQVLAAPALSCHLRPGLRRGALAAALGVRGLSGPLASEQVEGAAFAAPQPRATRRPGEQRRRTEAARLPLLEVSPKRKHRPGPKAYARRQRRHATDLEDLGLGEDAGDREAEPSPGPGPAPLVPRLRERQVRRLVQRPVAALPRTPQFFVRFGPPMTAEDLTYDAPSVLVESRKLIDDVLERRQAMQSAPDYVVPDTPFWRVPAKYRNRKGVKWQDEAPEGSEGPQSCPATCEEGQQDVGSPRAPADGEEAWERLRGIVDLGGAPAGRRTEALAPSRLASGLLAAGGSGASGGAGARETATGAVGAAAEALGTGTAAGGGRAAAAAARAGPAESLVAALRAEARAYAATGAHPDTRQGLEEALRQHPGAERAARLREMRACTLDFEALVREGRASLANCNALIRAQALQGRMDAAMRTHDAMKLHGYEPDDGTFVSLLVGAAQLRDAELARRLFLKMREQLISATPKVYAALIQAHVRARDVASGFSLLRKMEDERLEADVVVHTALINGLVADGRLERAWEEFHAARTWRLVQPDEVLFTVMIKACALAGEPERALNVLEDLRASGLYPTDLTYGELIHAMAGSSDHARKAFGFLRQMQAEDMPLGAFVFEKLLHACRSLGDVRRARAVLREMREHGVGLEPEMYCHLVGLFATAMRLPKATEAERLQGLRSSWQVVAEARRCCACLDWTRLLNEVLAVYVAGGFSRFAVDMLQQYALFGARPDASTYRQLLEMFGRGARDVGRFFALWEALPREPQPPAELYHLALEVALETRSARRTCAVLEELLAAGVCPTPQLAERLGRAGRHVLQVHQLVARLLEMNRLEKAKEARRATALLESRMDEREAELAVAGRTVRCPTPEQEARERHFEALRKRGHFRRPWLPLGEYRASKQKGGEAYAARHDRPRPNLLAP
mmetsp:Transcript_100185/g.323169  ORF Transcript_100185/g.323169 Transcript_100185/m.323169 type:complete len:917 (+) Transcript_100185:87-2837(+)